MMMWFLLSIAVTVFLLLALLFTFLGSKDPVEARLAQVSASTPNTVNTSLMNTAPSTTLGRAAMQVTSVMSPLRGLIAGSDADLEYKLTLAGFRKPEHQEIYTASKLLLP